MHIENTVKSSALTGYGISGLVGGIGSGGLAVVTLFVASKLFVKPSWRSIKNLAIAGGAGSVLGGGALMSLYALFKVAIGSDAPGPGLGGRDGPMQATADGRRPLPHAGGAALSKEPLSPLERASLLIRVRDLEPGAIRAAGRQGIELYPHYLTNAVRGRNLQAVEALLDAGCSIDYDHAIDLFDFPEALRAVFNHPSHPLYINQANSGGETLLHRAVAAGNYEAVEVLLDAGANPLLPDSDGNKPFHLVATDDRMLSLLRLMLERGGQFDINAKNGKGETALHVASVHGCLGIVRLLLDNGASPLVKDDLGGGQTLLHVLAEDSQRTAVLQVCLQRVPRERIDMVDDEGRTALCYAVRNNNANAVEMLLEGGADPFGFLAGQTMEALHSVEALGRSPLHLAGAKDKEILAKIVARVGSDQIDTLIGGETALSVACKYGSEESVELLVQFGANPTIVVLPGGSTSLHFVANYGSPTKLEKLLRSPRLQVDALDAQGWTALRLAIVWGHQGRKEKVEMLLRTGANPRLVPDSIRQSAGPEIQRLLSEAGRRSGS